MDNTATGWKGRTWGGEGLGWGNFPFPQDIQFQCGCRKNFKLLKQCSLSYGEASIELPGLVGLEILITT